MFFLEEVSNSSTNGIMCGGADVLRAVKFAFMMIDILLILVPIGLIIMVMVDFTKNVIANNMEDMKKHAMMALKRIINCVALFLVEPVVSFAITLVGNQGVNPLTCIGIAKYEDLSVYEIDFADEEYDVPNVDLTSPSGVVPSSGKGEQSSDTEVQKFIDALEKISSQVEKDSKKGKSWLYSNQNTKNTFKIANNSTKSTNCALYVVWGLIDSGIMKSGERFYKCYDNCNYTNKINYRSTSEAKMKEKIKFIDGGNKTASSLIENGTLQPGDIVLWYNHQHTNVYAGNKKWYDAGRQSGVNGSGSNDNYHFTTLGPVSLSGWMNEKVWKIMRVK